MGNVVKILVFVVGAIGLLLSGLNGAEAVNVDTDPLLSGMGDTAGGVASSARDGFGGLLDSLGAMMAGWTGADASSNNPGAVQKFGPETLGAIISALMMMFSTRRGH
jgi:hypothetical protein